MEKARQMTARALIVIAYVWALGIGILYCLGIGVILAEEGLMVALDTLSPFNLQNTLSILFWMIPYFVLTGIAGWLRKE